MNVIFIHFAKIAKAQDGVKIVGYLHITGRPIAASIRLMMTMDGGYHFLAFIERPVRLTEKSVTQSTIRIVVSLLVKCHRHKGKMLKLTLFHGEPKQKQEEDNFSGNGGTNFKFPGYIRPLKC